MLSALQMVPHIKKNTENLVTVMGEKAAAGEAFNVFLYVKYHLLALYSSSRSKDYVNPSRREGGGGRGREGRGGRRKGTLSVCIYMLCHMT